MYYNSIMTLTTLKYTNIKNNDGQWVSGQLALIRTEIRRRLEEKVLSLRGERKEERGGERWGWLSTKDQYHPVSLQG